MSDAFESKQVYTFEVSQVSENAIYVLFKSGTNEIASPQLTQIINLSSQAIRDKFQETITDLVPSYQSILVYFKLLDIEAEELIKNIKPLINTACHSELKYRNDRKLEIPIYFGPEAALDLTHLCEIKKLSTDKFISLFCKTAYTAYAIGFMPGFAFLGFVDSLLSYPRKPRPRKLVPAGSLGIADTQTGIYPGDTPGGWNIIGNSPINFAPQKDQGTTKLKVGDQVNFYPITKSEYDALKKEQE